MLFCFVYEPVTERFVLLNGPVPVGSWQGTAGSQRLELTVANVGTTGYHCKELLAFKVGTDRSQRGNHGILLQRTSGS